MYSNEIFIGEIAVWRPEVELPENFLHPRGQELNKADYPELWSVIQTYDEDFGSTEDTFFLPNLYPRDLEGLPEELFNHELVIRIS